MTLRSIEHYRQPNIRKFLDDMNRIGRMDLLLIKGGAFIQDLLVGMCSSRHGKDEEALRTMPFGKLAKLTLVKPQEAALFDLVLRFGRIRNRVAHELITDEFVKDF